MAVDMFLKIGDIKGESKDDAHADEIDVVNWDWGVSNSGSMHSGGGGGTGKSSVRDLSIVKYVDSSSPNLFRLCCSGDHVSDAVLTVRKSGGKPLEYLIIQLKKVMVTSVSTGGGSDDDRIVETITLNFAECEVKYTPQADDGTPLAEIPAGYNIEANTTS